MAQKRKPSPQASEGTIARTKRARSTTRTPSPPATPPRRRTKRATTSEEEPLPDYDTSRFTSKENQEWYEARQEKRLIKEKSVADEVEAYFHVYEQFAKLGWAPILRLPHYIYPKLVREFYANVVDKEKYSGDFLESYVRGRRLVVTRGVIAQILRCRDDGSNVKLRKGFYWPGTWNRAQAADRFHVRFRATRRSQKMALFASDFEPQHHLLLYLFAHNIIPKKSGMNELRNSDLYFLDAMINGRGLEFNSLSLPSIIISYMRTVARSKARSKAGKTCFGFPRLLTLLFESEGVNTERERRVQLDATNVVSITVLRQIRMPAAVIAEIQRGRPIGPSTSTHQGASTSTHL